MNEADLPFLRQVYASTRQAELDLVDWPQVQKDSFLEMQFNAQHAHYRQHCEGMDWLIISTGGIDIGRIYLLRGSEELRVVDISMLAAHRARSFGGTILSDILSEAAASDRRVSIHVEKYNPAMRLYERLGFIKVEDQGAYDLMHWTADQLNTAS